MLVFQNRIKYFLNIHLCAEGHLLLLHSSKEAFAGLVHAHVKKGLKSN